MWIPILTEPGAPLEERRIATPLLWEPTEQQARQLRADWQELTNLIAMGKIIEVSAHMGKYLQIRPKAANAKSLCWAFNADGERAETMPRGFYLRPSFTQEILRMSFILTDWS